MHSIKGRFQNGQLIIVGHQPSALVDGAEVLVTLIRKSMQDEKEESFLHVRSDERNRTDSTITILDGDQKGNYPLFDFSKNGLSFVAPAEYGRENGIIQAGITDPFNPDSVLMELELEIRSVQSIDKGMKVGCKFINQVDEDLWHGLQMFWG